MIHDKLKEFETKIEGLGTLQLFVDREKGCAWFQVTSPDDFDGFGWSAVRRHNGKIEFIAVNTVPPNCF